MATKSAKVSKKGYRHTLKHTDSKIIVLKRAQYINTSVDIRDIFSFAEPQQVLQAVNKYVGHHYGSMLWDMESDIFGQYCRAWNTCVKLCHNVPRSTHTYLVENVLASEFTPIRTEIMARYGKFYSSLKKSITVGPNYPNAVRKSLLHRHTYVCLCDSKRDLRTGFGQLGPTV